MTHGMWSVISSNRSTVIKTDKLNKMDVSMFANNLKRYNAYGAYS